MYNWHQNTGRVYVTSGIGYGRNELSAFDAAELDAHILAANAIKISSFIPPNWQIIIGKQGLAEHTHSGVFLPMAYAYAASNKVRVSASVLIGMNKDNEKASIIVEHADRDVSKEQAVMQSQLTMEEAYTSRGWEIDRIEEIALEALPKDNLYACALVAVVFLSDGAIQRG